MKTIKKTMKAPGSGTSVEIAHTLSLRPSANPLKRVTKNSPLGDDADPVKLDTEYL
jgi:hypothetical protein